MKTGLNSRSRSLGAATAAVVLCPVLSTACTGSVVLSSVSDLTLYQPVGGRLPSRFRRSARPGARPGGDDTNEGYPVNLNLQRGENGF